MLSKQALRLSLTGSRCLSSIVQLRAQNNGPLPKLRTQNVPKSLNLMPVTWQPTRLMSIAEDILKAQKEKEDKEKSQKQNPEEEGGKKGYKPLTKWQKRGYIFTAVFIGGCLVANIWVFCKFKCTVECFFARFCFVVKTSADNMIA